ncbi:(2Fe-2S) ferredoxin domain-containing protein [Halalkalibacter urbisdiaboli]|uniref:(2Fe-2S) ferredoxin domain-containing protein n=1 Tax=Halalkalibacter urbisdiaboli TaxID=1960589 RepID=UPI000B4530C0|nr:(2Fe-2S) ferredoxin domain-containing protein [Halalkalibacter urbisdiaboli]
MATWNLTSTQQHILICNGSSCKKAGAEEVTQSIRQEITERGLDPVLHTSRTLCNGRCQDKCVVIAYPEGRWYKEVTSEDAAWFVDTLITGASREDKVSHAYNGTCFERTDGTVAGVEKDVAIVKKVSKTF